MARSIWELFVALFRDAADADEGSGTDDGEHRFVPSPLDLSVRTGHGGADADGPRALAEASERARELDAVDHRD